MHQTHAIQAIEQVIVELNSTYVSKITCRPVLRNGERLSYRLGLGYGKPKTADCKQLG